MGQHLRRYTVTLMLRLQRARHAASSLAGIGRQLDCVGACDFGAVETAEAYSAGLMVCGHSCCCALSGLRCRSSGAPDKQGHAHLAHVALLLSHRICLAGSFMCCTASVALLGYKGLLFLC